MEAEYRKLSAWTLETLERNRDEGFPPMEPALEALLRRRQIRARKLLDQIIAAAPPEVRKKMDEMRFTPARKPRAGRKG